MSRGEGGERRASDRPHPHRHPTAGQTPCSWRSASTHWRTIPPDQWKAVRLCPGPAPLRSVPRPALLRAPRLTISRWLDSCAAVPTGAVGFCCSPAIFAHVIFELRQSRPQPPVIVSLEGGYSPHRLQQVAIEVLRVLASRVGWIQSLAGTKISEL